MCALSPSVWLQGFSRDKKAKEQPARRYDDHQKVVNNSEPLCLLARSTQTGCGLPWP